MGVTPPAPGGKQPVPAKMPKPKKGAKEGPGELRPHRASVPEQATVTQISYEEARNQFLEFARATLTGFSGDHDITIDNQGHVTDITGIPEVQEQALIVKLNEKLDFLNDNLRTSQQTIIQGKKITVNIPTPPTTA